MATDRNEKFRRWERSWERFRLREYPQPECILPHIVEDKARAHPDRVVFQFRDLPITSGELNENVNKFARGFQRLGVKRGDKVAVMLPNCPEYVYAWFGLAKIGAVELTIDQHLRGDGLWYQIDQSDCAAILADQEFLQYLEPIAGERKKLRHLVVYRRDGAEAPPAPRAHVGGNAGVLREARSDARVLPELLDAHRRPREDGCGRLLLLRRPQEPKTGSERVEKYKLKKEGVTPACWDREKAGYTLRR